MGKVALLGASSRLSTIPGDFVGEIDVWFFCSPRGTKSSAPCRDTPCREVC